PRPLDNRRTRGARPAERPRSEDVAMELGSDSRRTTQLGASLYYLWDRAGGTFGQYSLSLSVRPAAAALVSVGPTLSRTHSLAQYVTTVTHPVAHATSGPRD